MTAHQTGASSAPVIPLTAHFKRVRVALPPHWRLHLPGCPHALFRGELVTLPTDALPVGYTRCQTCLG